MEWEIASYCVVLKKSRVSGDTDLLVCLLDVLSVKRKRLIAVSWPMSYAAAEIPQSVHKLNLQIFYRFSVAVLHGTSPDTFLFVYVLLVFFFFLRGSLCSRHLYGYESLICGTFLQSDKPSHLLQFDQHWHCLLFTQNNNYLAHTV